MPDPDLLLPPGCRLVHIGPPKTATTVVQSAFHNNREALAEQGVHYAGRNRHPMSAALEVAQGRLVPGHDPRRRDRWERLLKEVDEADATRTVISSEFFADAPDTNLKRVVESVGRDRIHVVVTLRSLATILPSQWQQLTQVGLVAEYEQWLAEVFADPADPAGRQASFWRRHAHDVLVGRWARAVGTENLTVIGLGGTEGPDVLRVFEDLLGLRDRTLVPHPDDANRSLTVAETELMRAVNRQFQSEGFERSRYTFLIRYGLASHLKSFAADQDGGVIATPEWAVDKAVSAGRDAAAAIEGLGVRVVGDLSAALVRPPRVVGPQKPAAPVSLELMSRAVAGVVHGAERSEDLLQRRLDRDHGRERRTAVRAARAELRPALRRATIGEIGRELRVRLRRRVGRALRGRRGRRPSP